MTEHYEARFAAVGGQGILLAGDILANAAIKFEGKYAIDSPTYTAQVRGGPTKVDVIIDSKRIMFTRTTAIDFMLCLAQKSWNQFAVDLREDCVILIDPSLVHDVGDYRNVFEMPILEMTQKALRKMVYVSAVSLGAMVGLTDVLPMESVKKALLMKAPKGTEDQNLKAFTVGYEEAKRLKVK